MNLLSHGGDSKVKVQIYHNPRCSKSRAALELLRERGIEAEVVNYLDNPPNEEVLRELVGKLGVDSMELLRTNEPEFEQTGYDAAALTDSLVVECILRFPKLMQRPVVVNGDTAAIGRPPEKILEIL